MRYAALREWDYSELNIAKEDIFLDRIFICCNIEKEKQYTKQYKNKEYTKQTQIYKRRKQI